jgi:hypothetical protein
MAPPGRGKTGGTQGPVGRFFGGGGATEHSHQPPGRAVGSGSGSQRATSNKRPASLQWPPASSTQHLASGLAPGIYFVFFFFAFMRFGRCTCWPAQSDDQRVGKEHGPPIRTRARALLLSVFECRVPVPGTGFSTRGSRHGLGVLAGQTPGRTSGSQRRC